MIDFKNVLEQKTASVNEIISSYLPRGDENTERIVSAMNYSVQAGGKRIRPLLMMEAYACFSESQDMPDLLKRFMTAIECIHSYSLCHDDLPAMDNDRLRRGKASTWVRFDEAFGVLAGDALLNYAFELIASGLENCEDETLVRRGIKAFSILSKKAGIYGMIGGQSLDVYSEKTPGFETGIGQIMFIHKNKTAALLEAALMCGAVLSGADERCVQILEEAAENAGYAFQIRDDILDVTGDEARLGKPVGSDDKNNKQTYVTVYGLSRSQHDVEMFTDRSAELLKELPGRTEFLYELILALAGRVN